MIEPVASYRLQLGPELGFDEAIGLLDHLVSLGISHLYVSPVTEAVPGSSHGYDVVDHTTVRADLGGPEGFDALLDALAERGLALVVDHVPNHVSVARPDLNAPWWEMLRDGPGSPGAAWFDVDRSEDERVILPILAAPVDEMREAGRFEVDGEVLVVDGAVRLPLARGTSGLPLAELLDQQHYRLVWWRRPERNVRRFFTIDDLVAVRAEVPEVAEAVDTLPERLVGHRAFGGVRVDHLDGLADPLGYLTQLRRRIGDQAWLVIEKIVAPDEALPEVWPVDGTTGYEFARMVDHLLLDASAELPLNRLWISATGDPRPFHEIEEAARREVLAGGLHPDLARTVSAAAAAVGHLDHLEAAVIELTVALPRYRTYLPDDPDARSVVDKIARRATTAVPHARETIERLVAALLDPSGDAEVAFRTRWQQLTGPAMAKGAEDRAFYRYLRLASTCEVGGDPGTLGVSVDEFHEHQIAAQQRWPRAMLTASTHDTKRSDDVRARSAALTMMAATWATVADRWVRDLSMIVPDVPPASALLAIQTVATCPGIDGQRLSDFLVKAAREADLETSWTDPDADHEAMLAAVAAALTEPSTLADDVAHWSARLNGPGLRMSLAATALRMVSPGVPDIYQGTEMPSFRLVDPDNRHTPDWSALRAVTERVARLDGPTSLADDPEASKAVVITRSLALRRRHLFAFGDQGRYEPIPVSGSHAGSFVAFTRGPDVIAVVAVGAGRDGLPTDHDPTTLELPAGRWRDVFDDDAIELRGLVVLDDLVERFPAALLERID